MFLTLNLWTLLVYIIVGRKSMYFYYTSYFAWSATAEALSVRFFYVFSIKTFSGSGITSSIMISASSPGWDSGAFSSSSFFYYFFPFLASFFPPFFANYASSYLLFFSSYFFFSIHSYSVFVTNLLTVIESSQSVYYYVFCLTWFV